MKKICPRCGIVDKSHKCRKIGKKIDDGFYSKYNWIKLRKRILEQQPYCLRCLSKYGQIVDDKLEGHHLLARSEYPEFELFENNVVMLCKDCNLRLSSSSILDFELNNKDKEEFYYNNKRK
ncbi:MULTISPECIES: HNH endonuclease [unclassified Clostridium]|uniref:HNH endonuclease n=1 Tax=Clostridium sp. UMB9555A TaxID=3050593 RepID=UPI00254C4090|nr:MULTISPECIES: HNH endonuclease [unclassified Clostridium]MDK7589907.1 HNH endonuclease [Clostridium sp. UMB9555B]MDK7627699.1 HNH endonuclease [Clostridium sp. UMB9555A]